MDEVRDYEMLIDGAWTGASDGGLFESANPATGKVWSRVPEAMEADVDGTLWLSSGRETFRFDPATGAVASFRSAEIRAIRRLDERVTIEPAAPRLGLVEAIDAS